MHFPALPLAIVLASGSALAQDASPRPSFEVAAIRPSNPANGIPGKGKALPGGRIELYGMTAKDMVVFAYGVQPDMVLGAPKWAESARYDLVAKKAPDAPLDAVHPMMQSLLTDRLKLVLHRDEKFLPVYVLARGNSPLELTEHTSGDSGGCAWSSLDDGLARRDCKGLSMAEFTRQLPGLGGAGLDGRFVVDETGLRGVYDFHFDLRFPPKSKPGVSSTEPPEIPVPNIFDALRKIGLLLEERKRSVHVLVIDHIEPPAEN